MNTKVNLMAAGGTAAVAVSKPAVKTDCQKDAFSKTLDGAQQAREQKAARTDDTAKDHEGKTVKPEDKTADAPEKAEDGGKADTGAEDAKAGDAAGKDQQKDAGEGRDTGDGSEKTDTSAADAKIAAVLAAAGNPVLQELPMAELNTYFAGDARLQGATAGVPQQSAQAVPEQAQQSAEPSADSKMAAALAKMTPAEGETAASAAEQTSSKPAQQAQTQPYAATPIEALLGRQTQQASAESQNTVAQSGSQQMLELLAGQRVYAGDSTQKTEDSTVLSQLNELVGTVEVVQAAPQENLGNSRSFQQNQQGAMAESQVQQGIQLPEESAFDAVLPGDSQPVQDGTNAKNADAQYGQGLGIQQLPDGTQSNAQGTQSSQGAQQTAGSYEAYDVPKQIVEQAKLLQKGADSEMIIKLNPEHLGQLSLKVSVNGNGGVTATFHTDNAQVRAVLETTMLQLKQQLNDQGIKVDSVEVQAGLPDGQLPQNQGQQGGYQQAQGEQVRSQQADLKDFEEAAEALSAEPVNAAENVVHDSQGNQISRGVDYSV